MYLALCWGRSSLTLFTIEEPWKQQQMPLGEVTKVCEKSSSAFVLAHIKIIIFPHISSVNALFQIFWMGGWVDKCTRQCFKAGCRALMWMQHKQKLPLNGTYTHMRTHFLSHRHLERDRNTFSMYSYDHGCLLLYFHPYFFGSVMSEKLFYEISASWHQAHRPARLLCATVDFQGIFSSSWSHRNVLALTQQHLSHCCTIWSIPKY